jgi:hypothetical protein
VITTFAETPATFEMAVCLLRLGKRERPIDHAAQAVHLDCRVHGLEIDSACALIEPSVIPRPVSNKGSRLLTLRGSL